MSNYLRTSYDILSKIYREKTFSTEALYGALENADDAPIVHRIVMGTIEKDTQLEYILSQLAEKSPKAAVKIIIKQGLYCLKYMDGLPDYAVINNSVELTKTLGKTGVSGFVNAVLKKAAAGQYEMPVKDSSLKSLSINYSVPEWIIRSYIKDFGLDKAVEILSAKTCEMTHIRINHIVFDDKSFISVLEKENAEFFKTEAGFLTRVTPTIKKLFADGMITYQSATSIKAVDALGVINGQDVLDICSAPGGKAVLIAERDRSGTVTACDLHLHRVKLIGAYAKRMGVRNIVTMQMDATKYNSDFTDRFDRVLVDAPCSALGIIRKHPDILLNRKESDIGELAAIQLKILKEAAKYVKKGGLLVYSTCTLTKKENEDVLDKFEKTNPQLRPEIIEEYGEARHRFFPNNEIDGFFVAKYKKI